MIGGLDERIVVCREFLNRLEASSIVEANAKRLFSSKIAQQSGKVPYMFFLLDTENGNR